MFTTRATTIVAIVAMSCTFNITDVPPALSAAKDIHKEIPAASLPGVYILDNHSGYQSLNSYFTVVGEVVNNSPDIIRYVQVSVDFYDKNDILQKTDFTFTKIDNMIPGTRSCFSISVPDAGNIDQYEFASVSYHKGGSAPPDLSLDRFSSSATTDNNQKITGAVYNNSGELVRYVSAVASIYAPDNTIIGCSRSFADNTHLPAQQSASFAINAFIPQNTSMAKYDVQLEGKTRQGRKSKQYHCPTH